jgi:CO/xanthine dehydrogenase FAD-binding subunit
VRSHLCWRIQGGYSTCPQKGLLCPIHDTGDEINVLRLPKFDYFAPRSLEEASTLLIKGEGGVRILAGGTDLLVKMKKQEMKCDGVIGLKNITGLDAITLRDNLITLGPLVTHRAVAYSISLNQYAHFFSDACRDLGTYQVRYMGTVAGNICNGSPSADSIPSLLVLEAQLRILGPDGERILPMDQFFLGPFQTILKKDEILTSIEIPIPPPSHRGVYLKIPKVTEKDETLVGVAMLLVQHPSAGAIEEIRIGLGSVAPIPLRARATEAYLKGKDPRDEKVLSQARELLSSEISPRSRAEYRRRMAEYLFDQALGNLREDRT